MGTEHWLHVYESAYNHILQTEITMLIASGFYASVYGAHHAINNLFIGCNGVSLCVNRFILRYKMSVECANTHKMNSNGGQSSIKTKYTNALCPCIYCSAYPEIYAYTSIRMWHYCIANERTQGRWPHDEVTR